MQKFDFKPTNTKEVQDFIKEIQKEFPCNNVNINNVNDFFICLEQKRNCMDCKGLDYCKNTEVGHYTEFINDQFVVTPCKYKKEVEAKNNSLINTLYLPRKILDASIEDFDAVGESRKKIYKHMVEGIKSDTFCKGLYLYGTASIGKTFTLSVIANEYAKIGKKSLLIYFPDLVLDLKNAMGTSRFEELINMLKSIDVLMLDDIGSENITPWVRDEILGPVINYRMMAELPLYASSNLGPKALEDHLSIDGSPASQIKASRITNRMTSILVSLNMGDSKKYKR